MLNQSVIVGRLVDTPAYQETETGKKLVLITVAVPRSYKNANGEYETDFIDCTLWSAIAENSVEYLKKGDLLGIKGRLQTEKENDRNVLRLVAEKITFLSSKDEKKEDSNE